MLTGFMLVEFIERIDVRKCGRIRKIHLDMPEAALPLLDLAAASLKKRLEAGKDVGAHQRKHRLRLSCLCVSGHSERHIGLAAVKGVRQTRDEVAWQEG